MSKPRFAIVPDTAILAIGKVSNLAGVYMFYAMHADRDGSNARPSVVSAAKFFNIQRRSVERCLAWLARNGLMIEDGVADNRITRYRMVRNMSLSGDILDLAKMPHESDMPLEGGMSLEGGNQMPLESAARCRLRAAQPDPLTRPVPEIHGDGGPPHVAARGAGGDEEAPFGRQDQDQEGADAPAVEREVALGRSAYAEVDARADAEEALIAQHRAKQERDFQETCIRDEAEALLKAGLYSTLPPAARLPALVSLTRDYRTRWPRSWPSAWLKHAASLNGAIKDKPAFVATHLEGYARKDWIPENKTEPERFDHLRLLKGEPA